MQRDHVWDYESKWQDLHVTENLEFDSIKHG